MCLPLDTKHPYCKIVLVGPLVEHWADYLGDMLLEVEVRDGEVQTSTLTGQPADLLAFIGMLSASLIGALPLSPWNTGEPKGYRMLRAHDQ